MEAQVPFWHEIKILNKFLMTEAKKLVAENACLESLHYDQWTKMFVHIVRNFSLTDIRELHSITL